jgi:hypothetical protein
MGTRQAATSPGAEDLDGPVEAPADALEDALAEALVEAVAETLAAAETEEPEAAAELEGLDGPAAEVVAGAPESVEARVGVAPELPLDGSEAGFARTKKYTAASATATTATPAKIGARERPV